MKIRVSIFGLLLLFTSSVSAQADIRKIDFKNFTYPAICIGEKPANVTVKNGEFFEEKQEDGYVDRFYFRILDVTYGDVTGDQIDEAIILGVCNTGGTGNFSEGFIYSMKETKPSLMARIPGGDRAYGGLRRAYVEGGLLVVESNDVGELGGACCPEVIVTTKYKLAGDRIVQSGKVTRRDIFPEVKITFAKGSSGKTFTATIGSGEGARYVLGARANQTLTVSVDNENAQLKLLEDAGVTQGTNNFSAKLPKTGNYTVEIRNDSVHDIRVTVNIRIQ